MRNEVLGRSMLYKSETRISKSETNSNVQISNDKNARCAFSDGMFRLKHSGFGFWVCFGFRDSDFEFAAPKIPRTRSTYCWAISKECGIKSVLFFT